MTRPGLVIAYATFAALSIAVNICAQALAMMLYAGRGAIPFSIAIGTAAGLISKYVLDKRYIFLHRSSDTRQEARTFALYTLMGGATTAIFWGTETAFHLIFANDTMRYVGGIIGLCIGYVIKYWLDARFVFNSPQHSAVRQAKSE